MLNYLDDLDSKLESMRASLEESQGRGEWTGYNPSLERLLLQKDRFLDESAETPLPEEPPGSAPDFEEQSGPMAGPTTAGRKPQPLSLFGERLQSALQRPKEGQ
jgi:hypothetical protein